LIRRCEWRGRQSDAIRNQPMNGAAPTSRRSRAEDSSSGRSRRVADHVHFGWRRCREHAQKLRYKRLEICHAIGSGAKQKKRQARARSVLL